MGNIYKNENQLLLQELIKIYNPTNYDWLSYQITKNNILTLHHIIKASDGGELSRENAALLTKRAQRVLHMCEYKDFILYSEINDFFKEIISYGNPLNDYFEKQSRKYKRVLAKTLYK